jgi:hypothetical protein
MHLYPSKLINGYSSIHVPTAVEMLFQHDNYTLTIVHGR